MHASGGMSSVEAIPVNSSAVVPVVSADVPPGSVALMLELPSSGHPTSTHAERTSDDGVFTLRKVLFPMSKRLRVAQ